MVAAQNATIELEKSAVDVLDDASAFPVKQKLSSMPQSEVAADIIVGSTAERFGCRKSSIDTTVTRFRVIRKLRATPLSTDILAC